MTLFMKLFKILVLLMKVNVSSIQWERVRCASDPDRTNTEGTVADIGRFPWLGVIQHSFLIGSQTKFAITSGLLIHPAYVIAPAEDIAKITRDQLRNNTKFIMWYSDSVKYALGLRDYIMHPEYVEGRTQATIALVEVITYGETGVGDNPKPVLPICMPLIGTGSFTDIYAVKMTDENKELQKEFFKMLYVDSRDCNEFYYTAKVIRNTEMCEQDSRPELDHKKMAPSFPTCAKVEQAMPPCVWDGGAVLITSLSWGYWALLGFSVRGPGCGAPTRFLNMHDYLPWINDMISPKRIDQHIIMNRIGVRQLSPTKIMLYNAKKRMPAGTGQCEKKNRGVAVYKDYFEIAISGGKVGHGFFFIAVSQIASFTCALVDMKQVTAKSNTAVWIEHYCHRELRGAASQMKPREYRKLDCFMYFKSAAFVEFRFKFIAQAVVQLSLFGTAETGARIPSPFVKSDTTDKWFPTTDNLKWDNFAPQNLSWDNL